MWSVGPCSAQGKEIAWARVYHGISIILLQFKQWQGHPCKAILLILVALSTKSQNGQLAP